MKLWLDNTGFHAIGRCLERMAKGEPDVSEYLQFASRLVITESFAVYAHETPAILERASSMQALLAPNGFKNQDLLFESFSKQEIRAAALKAANRLGADLDFAFPPNDDYHVSGARAAFPDLSKTDSRTFDEIKDLLLRQISDSERQQSYTLAFESYAVPAQAIMLLASDRLWTSARRLARARDWTDNDTSRLLVHMRYYLNEELANERSSKYAPAVSRARMVAKGQECLLAELNRIIADAANAIRHVAAMQPLELDLPPIAAVLANLGKGEPEGILQEALKMRAKATPLRKSFQPEKMLARFSDGEQRFQIQQDIVDLNRRLREELRLESVPSWRSFLDFRPIGDSPIPKANRILDFAEQKIKAARVSVLSEFAKAAAYGLADSHLQSRLQKHFFDGKK